MSQETKYVHPLMRKTIGVADSSPEWLEKWTQAMAEEVPDAGELEGLLYRVPEFHSPDLILLCFDIADGYNSWDSDFRAEGESDGHSNSSPAKLRLQIAQKAFWALCEGLFKDTTDRNRYSFPSWAGIVAQERILRKIFWFVFDNDRRGRGVGCCSNLRPNAQDNHQNHLFRSFLVELVRFTWQFRSFQDRFETEEDRVIREMFNTFKPEFIEILYRLNRLDVLEGLAPMSTDMFRGRRGLDHRERRKLKELALSRSLDGVKAEDIWQLMEARVAVGDPAAEFLWCYLPRVKAVRHWSSQQRAEKRKYQEKQKEGYRQTLLEKQRKMQEELRKLKEQTR